ncbi:hypothetical protein KJS94_00145 [Flavihumibacter rivuli]|uniref:hypothetical protein n=1 Tax=Flavihumibacter rivuli TaxID=2838156 RepID=UPI001BDDCE0B|nr:hypothetical protein [Flavihumibacter rivuli]ULQ56612.1 hypothetical protein KJS94_00145 [Flavihumibacter rivuli]
MRQSAFCRGVGLLIFVGSLFMVACQKNQEPDARGPVTDQRDGREEGRTFLQQLGLKAGDSARMVITEAINSLDKPGLQTIEVAEGERIWVFPMNTAVKLQFGLSRFSPDKQRMVVLRSKAGKFTTGNIIEFDPLPGGGKLEGESLKQYLVKGRLEVDGTLTSYSLGGALLGRYSFRNGDIETYAVPQERKQGPMQAGSGSAWSSDCTYYFLLVYSGGDLVATQLLSYTCETSGTCGDYMLDCGSGGGGGGTGTSVPEDCSDVESKLGGTAQSGAVKSAFILNQTDIRKKSYKWMIYKQSLGMFAFYSHEIATHRRVNGVWRFESLVHQTISKEGFIPIGTADVTLNTAVSHVGLYNAIMELNCTYTTTFSCKELKYSGSRNFSAVKNFHVND